MTRALALIALLSLAAGSAYALPNETEQQTAAASGSKENNALASAVGEQLQDLQTEGELAKEAEIKVRVDDAVVWLSGRVATSRQLRAVLRRVARTAGVRQVVHDLRVNERRTDRENPSVGGLQAIEKVREVQRQVQQTIAPSYPIPYSTPKWNTQREAPREKRKAKAVAQQIADTIADLHESNKLGAYEVSIELFDGIVVLRGKVTSEQDRMTLLRCAGRPDEVDYLCYTLDTAADEELANRATSATFPLSKLSVPAGAKWLANKDLTHDWRKLSRHSLRWDDGWWELDFQRKPR